MYREEQSMFGSGRPFKKGHSVKVKEGVMCPDYEGLCLAGWQGRIFDIEKVDQGRTIIGIRWDSQTLETMPIEFIEDSETNGDDYTEIYFYAEEVEPAKARDSEKDSQKTRDKLHNKYHWLGLGQEGRRILAVIGHVNPNDELEIMEAWETHLCNVLKIPFDAEVTEIQEHGPLAEGDKVQVHRIAEVDALYGILVEITHLNNSHLFPLSDLTVVPQQSLDYLPVQDYCVWFANR